MRPGIREDGRSSLSFAVSNQYPRMWLTELSQALGRPATLDDIPYTELDRLAVLGFGRSWFPSV